jgi:rhodanese-related sulfurtransferase/CBS domain-containing protein
VVKRVDTAQVQPLLEAGAQIVEVLPASAWRTEHLPGARNIPLPDLRGDAVDDLDPSRPIVVYCYDHECDLSARAAARLVALGFEEVYDYVASKTAWLGSGLPSEGEVPPEDRAGHLATRVPTCGPEATIGEIRDQLTADGTLVVVVVDSDDIVLGALHADAAGLPPGPSVMAAADPGPASVRPSITRHELAKSMDDGGQHHVLVSTSHGELLGLVRRTDLG